jgi:hypothetical protein
LELSFNGNPDTDKKEPYIYYSLAGIAAEKILTPRKTLTAIANSGGANDWKNLRDVLQRHVQMCDTLAVLKAGKRNEAIAMVQPRSDDSIDLRIYLEYRDVRRFIKARWADVSAIAVALLASPNDKLTYQQCRRILAVRQAA